MSQMYKFGIETGGWRTSPFILVSQCFAVIGFQGVMLNLVLNLTNVLNDGNAQAANFVSNLIGTSYLTCIIGALIGDSYLGRYLTILIFLTIANMGLSLLSLSTFLLLPRMSQCSNNARQCQHANTAKKTVFYIALYTIALGNGGYRPCISTFGAEQFNDTYFVDKKQTNVFFSWYYVASNTGGFIAATMLVYIESNVNWVLGYGLCTAFLGVSLTLFSIGTPFYRKSQPHGNPFVQVAQVLVAMIRKINVKVPLDKNLLHKVEETEGATTGGRKIMHSEEFSFLDKAATKTNIEEASTSELSPWYLCTLSQVEEVKCIFRITPIWISNVVFSTIFVQVLTLFVEQGAAMNTHIGTLKLPPATMSTVRSISIVVFTICYEYLFVPCARRLSGHERGLTSLQRMGTGFFVMALAMTAAATVEKYRLEMAQKHGFMDKTETAVCMSVLWQIPQYFLVGAAEVFSYIGELEFYYDQVPDEIRGLGVALSYLSYGVGSYVSTLLVTLVTYLTRNGDGDGWISNNLNRGHLDWFFWLMAILSLTNLAVYMVSALRYKGIKVNNMAPLA